MSRSFNCPQCMQWLPESARFCTRCGMRAKTKIPHQPRRAGVLAWIVFNLILFAGISAVVLIFAGSAQSVQTPAFRSARQQPVSDVPLHISATEPRVVRDPP